MLIGACANVRIGLLGALVVKHAGGARSGKDGLGHVWRRMGKRKGAEVTFWS